MLAYSGYVLEVFSRLRRESSVLAEGKSHERRSREKNERDSMKTWQTPKIAQEKSLAPRVYVGLNHSQLESHFEQSDFKFRGTLIYIFSQC